MANPKRKHTASRRDSRRSANWRLVAQSLAQCPHCGVRHLPHRICPGCGFYGKELVLPKKVKKKPGEQEGGTAS